MNTEDPTPYPRDFKGYGGNPPDPKWPDGARVAVSIVLNVEAGSELSLADGDESNESVYEIVEPSSRAASSGRANRSRSRRTSPRATSS